jgi:hypothetical protein
LNSFLARGAALLEESRSRDAEGLGVSTNARTISEITNRFAISTLVA